MNPPESSFPSFFCLLGVCRRKGLCWDLGRSRLLTAPRPRPQRCLCRGRPPGCALAPGAGFSPALWSQHPSLVFVHSNALGTGGANRHWPMTTVRSSPMGQSACWEKRPTIPGMSNRTRRVCMSLWGGQEQLTDPCNSLGNAWLFKSAAKVTALHRSMESFRCHGHAGCALGAKPAHRGWLW